MYLVHMVGLGTLLKNENTISLFL